MIPLEFCAAGLGQLAPTSDTLTSAFLSSRAYKTGLVVAFQLVVSAEQIPLWTTNPFPFPGKVPKSPQAGPNFGRNNSGLVRSYCSSAEGWKRATSTALDIACRPFGPIIPPNFPQSTHHQSFRTISYSPFPSHFSFAVAGRAMSWFLSRPASPCICDSLKKN